MVKAARSSLDSSFAQAAATAIASGGASLMTANAPPRVALEIGALSAGARMRGLGPGAPGTRSRGPDAGATRAWPEGALAGPHDPPALPDRCRRELPAGLPCCERVRRRYVDANNYDVARANALEGNVVLYKVGGHGWRPRSRRKNGGSSRSMSKAT